MKNWTVTDKTISQVKYYVARMQNARAKDGASLRSVIADLFSVEKDAAKNAAIKAAYMKPLQIPAESAYTLADYIITLTTQHCINTELFVEDQTAAIDQMLTQAVENCSSVAELIQCYHYIEQSLINAADAFNKGTNLSFDKIKPYVGEVTPEAAYAMRGRIVSLLTAMNPSEKAMRRMASRLESAQHGNVARFEYFAYGGMEMKAMIAAVMYALRCDGSLPAEADDVMLEQLVIDVCMDIDMQAVADTMDLHQKSYSTVYAMLDSAWIVSLSFSMIALIKAVDFAAVGAAVIAAPAYSVVAFFALLAVTPIVFDAVVNMIHNTSASAADFVIRHEAQIDQVQQACRAARDKCAAVFHKIADAIPSMKTEAACEIITDTDKQQAYQSVQQIQPLQG